MMRTTVGPSCLDRRPRPRTPGVVATSRGPAEGRDTEVNPSVAVNPRAAPLVSRGMTNKLEVFPMTATSHTATSHVAGARIVAAATLVLLLGACSSTSANSSTNPPAAGGAGAAASPSVAPVGTNVGVVEKEFSITLDKASFTAGDYTFAIQN